MVQVNGMLTTTSKSITMFTTQIRRSTSTLHAMTEATQSPRVC
jgi:hypothetical protein